MPEGAYEGYVVTGRYKLPEGLACKRCIVQMVYCESFLYAVRSLSQFFVCPSFRLSREELL